MPLFIKCDLIGTILIVFGNFPYALSVYKLGIHMHQWSKMGDFNPAMLRLLLSNAQECKDF